jgi:hypothetical protein
MSAYVVDNKTVERILDFIRHDQGRGVGAISRRHIARYSFEGWDLDSPEGLEILGRELLTMNREAVMQRYPDCRDNPSNMPGPINPQPFSYSNGRPHPSIFQTHKSIACLRYQCSEGDVPDWPLFKRLDDYAKSLAEFWLESQPDYEKSDWS